MKITRKVREEAALLCAIAASTSWELMPLHEDASLDHSSEWFQSGSPDVHTEAGALAIAAAATVEVGYFTADERWAEAEAMLRTGWSPE